MVETYKVMTRESYEAYFKETGTLSARFKRHIKTNFGKKTALGKLIKLIETTDFVNLEQSDKLIDWEKTPKLVW